LKKITHGIVHMDLSLTTWRRNSPNCLAGV